MDKLFIRVQDLKDRMGINPELDVDSALESAIHAAQLRLEQYIDSKLERQTWHTRFHLDKDSYSGIQPGGMFRCYLQSGLVTRMVPMVVRYGDAWNVITQVMPEADYYVDTDKGICYIDEKWADRFVSIEYATGYEKASQVPGWLSEAIMAYAPVVLNFSQVTNRNDEAEAGYRTSGDHALAVAAPYTRNVGMTIRPLF